MDYLKFSQLLCSRLCHDLISPVGAISNGFELLETCEEEDRAELMAMTQQSAATVVRRLRFFRAAFGYSAHSTFDAVKQTIDAYLTPIQITFHWPDMELFHQTEAHNLPLWERLIMNCVLMGSEGMPYGGDIRFEKDTTSPQGWLFTFTGKMATLRAEIQEALTQTIKEGEESSSLIQALLIKRVAQDLALTCALDVHDKQRYALSLQGQA